jgi:Family of unknown function (DUF6256)
MSSSLIRQDLVPMIVGYALIMGSLATGLRIVQRSGRAEAAGTGDAEATGTGDAKAAGTGDPTGASPVTARARRRSMVRMEPGWRRLVAHWLGTAVGGYLLLMAVIIAYYYGVARVAGNFVDSAFSGCAMLIGLATPVFFVLSWLVQRKGWRL